MSVETWAWLWKVLFFSAVTVFAGMAIWVTIGGWIDIRSLFRDLSERPEEKDERDRH